MTDLNRNLWQESLDEENEALIRGFKDKIKNALRDIGGKQYQIDQLLKQIQHIKTDMKTWKLTPLGKDLIE